MFIIETNTVFDDLMQALQEVKEYQKGNLKVKSRIIEIPDDEIESCQIYKKLSEANKQKAKSYVSELLQITN